MGKPSDKKRSARRPGKRERMRVKNFRPSVRRFVPGSDFVHVKYGRKKARRVHAWLCRDFTHHVGEPVKSESEIK